VKNNLATVQAIISQTLRGDQDPGAMREALLRRITALAAAHDILTREKWDGADVAEIAAGVLTALDEAGARVRVEGPALRLNTKAALALAMAFHELGTNALKYGALSRPEGEVRLAWRVAGDPATLTLDWTERGGPPVAAPASYGFGTRLLKRGLAAELGGAVEMYFSPEGFSCAIQAALTDAVSPPAGATWAAPGASRHR